MKVVRPECPARVPEDGQVLVIQSSRLSPAIRTTRKIEFGFAPPSGKTSLENPSRSRMPSPGVGSPKATDAAVVYRNGRLTSVSISLRIRAVCGASPSRTLYTEIDRHRIPMEREVVIALANSPGVLDFYVWIAWRSWVLKSGNIRVPIVSSGGSKDQLR